MLRTTDKLSVLAGCLFAIFAILSCGTEPKESAKSAPPDTTNYASPAVPEFPRARSSAVTEPAAASSTPRSEQWKESQKFKSAPPDTTDYSSPAVPGKAP